MYIFQNELKLIQNQDVKSTVLLGADIIGGQRSRHYLITIKIVTVFGLCIHVIIKIKLRSPNILNRTEYKDSF